MFKLGKSSRIVLVRTYFPHLRIDRISRVFYVETFLSRETVRVKIAITNLCFTEGNRGTDSMKRSLCNRLVLTLTTWQANRKREFIGNESIRHLEHIILSRRDEDAGGVVIREKCSTRPKSETY